VIPPEVHTKLLAHATPWFAAFLKVLHATGARPGEIAALTAQHIDWANGVALLIQHKTTHTTGRPRVIYLPPDALAILAAQREQYPTGPLLRNRDGGPWKYRTYGQAMRATA
jgi:integrase/recombinase XerC